MMMADCSDRSLRSITVNIVSVCSDCSMVERGDRSFKTLTLQGLTV